MALRRRRKDTGSDGSDAELQSPGVESTDAGDADTATELPAEELAAEEKPVEGFDEDWPSIAKADREGGPWDSESMAEDKVERVDLSGVRVPIVAGMELRAELTDEQEVVAVTLILGRSALQIQPFAAPRTLGIWDEVRDEIAEGIRASGGTATLTFGRFGAELCADVGVVMPDGTTGVQTARFLGIDGPRWFLRAVITGEAASDEVARAQLEDLLADVVVVRGVDPMAPREPIALALPDMVEVGEPGEAFEATGPAEGADDAPSDEDAAAQPKRIEDFNPFERGPEITEVR
ncbi:MAG: DUF3710 domain-containing protein [Sporichthyaceae bacterium]